MSDDLTGLRFGKWTVLSYAGCNHAGKAKWLCRCDCGKEYEVQAYPLRTGRSLQCKPCTRTKHGKARTRLYGIWKGMRKRCRDTADVSYKYYGARGIKTCSDWDNFKSFQDWAHKNGYRDELTIDRIDNDGNYEPSNCRWVTTREQNLNKRHHVWVEYDGKKMPLSEACRQSGTSYAGARSRLNKGESWLPVSPQE